MSMTIGTLAADTLSAALGFAITFTGTAKYDLAIKTMKLTGQALIDLADKGADGKITEDEINDAVAKVQAVGGDSVVGAVKSAVSRIVESIFK